MRLADLGSVFSDNLTSWAVVQETVPVAFLPLFSVGPVYGKVRLGWKDSHENLL